MEVHRCKFVPYTPHAINCLSATFDGKRIAVGRANADVEVYNIEQNWFLEKRIPGGKDLSVETVGWTNQPIPRLFSAGLHSVITEWDLNKLCPKFTTDSFGGAVWCIAIHPDGKMLAAGCEDGCVRLYDIGGQDIVYLRSFDPQEGRILSMAWDVSGTFLATGGSDGHIRKWDVSIGRATHRLALETRGTTPTLAWAIVVLPDDTIVCGDSVGNVHFWNTTQGEVVQTLRSHDLDVLCLASTREGDVVFASGVDTKIVRLAAKAQPNGRKLWTILNSLRVHTHDVRALTMGYLYADDPILVSGGVDTSILSTKKLHNQGSVQKIHPFPQRPIVHFSPIMRLLLHQDAYSLHLYRLETTTNTKSNRLSNKVSKTIHESSNGDNSSVGATGMAPSSPSTKNCQYVHLLDIFPETERSLICSTISNDGQHIACSTDQWTKLFHLNHDEHNQKTVNVEKKALSKSVLPAHCIIFSGENMVIATQEMTIQVVNVESGNVLQTFEQHRHGDASTITTLAASLDGQWLASCDLLGRIFIYHLDSMQMYTSFPKLDFAITHLAFDGNGKQLIATLTNKYFVIFDVEKKEMSEWSRQHQLKSFPEMFVGSSLDMILGAVFHPSDPTEVILHGLRFLCRVQLTKKIASKNSQSNQPRRLKKRKSGGNNFGDLEENFKMTNKYQPLLFVGFLNNNALVVVEREWLDIMRNLPETYRRKIYGS